MKKIFFLLFVVAALASGCSAKHWCAPASSLGAASAAPGGFIVAGGAVGVCVIAKGVEKMVSDPPAKEEKKPEDLGPKRVGPTIQTEQELQAEEAETEQVEVETVEVACLPGSLFFDSPAGGVMSKGGQHAIFP